jgi:AcrR family transcriptional regulator
MDKAVKRSYRSPLRQAQAQMTRETVIEAAARLFVERGYVATSIDAVAGVAGVSRVTVFNAVGGKAALLKDAYDVAVIGDAEAVPLSERSWAHPVRDESDPMRMLDSYAGLVADVCGRVSPLYEVLREAASADTDVLQLWNEIQEERRGGMTDVVAVLADKGRLQEGLDLDTAADVLWVLTDPGLYHQLVHGRGWPPDRFTSWLSRSMVGQLLP